MRILLAVVAGLPLLTAGCSTVTPYGASTALAATGPVYRSGRAVRSFSTSDGLVDKARLAMEDVGVHSIVPRTDGRSTVLEGRTATGRKAAVTVQPDGAGSLVSARFGPLGDEPLSLAFLDRLATHTGERPGDAKVATTETDQARPAPNRASSPPSSMLERQLEGGYRDSVSP